MLVDFYSGKAKDSQDRSFDDLLELGDDVLDETRDYIPWAFPLLEESRVYSGAPILAPDELEKFRTDDALRANVKRFVNRYLKFLHGNLKWRNAVDQNHSKISQMIKFLSVINMNEEANKIASWCAENGGSKRTHQSWEKALSTRAPWEVPTEDKYFPDPDETAVV